MTTTKSSMPLFLQTLLAQAADLFAVGALVGDGAGYQAPDRVNEVIGRLPTA